MKDKKVLITGGGKGIGQAIVKKFFGEGYPIVVVDKDFSNFSLNNEPSIEKIQFDLTEIEHIKDLAKKIGHVDILVNNAGILNSITYKEYNHKKRDDMLKVNLIAPTELITYISETMVEQKRGRIVNVSSLAGQIGHSDIWYGITKAGIINLTKSFSKILGPAGIVINSIALGPVDTDMLKTAPIERVKQFKESSIEKRFLTTKEVADIVYWLAVESSSYINGICIDVNDAIHL